MWMSVQMNQTSVLHMESVSMQRDPIGACVKVDSLLTWTHQPVTVRQSIKIKEGKNAFQIPVTLFLSSSTIKHSGRNTWQWLLGGTQFSLMKWKYLTLIFILCKLDIDECGLNETLCGPHGYCENRLGSFQCLCDQGYQESQDGQHCVGKYWIWVFFFI